jgi:hypothetical protein
MGVLQVVDVFRVKIGHDAHSRSFRRSCRLRATGGFRKLVAQATTMEIAAMITADESVKRPIATPPANEPNAMPTLAAELTDRLEADDPAELADHLTLVLEGLLAASQSLGPGGPAKQARRLAEAIHSTAAPRSNES